MQISKKQEVIDFRKLEFPTNKDKATMLLLHLGENKTCKIFSQDWDVNSTFKRYVFRTKKEIKALFPNHRELVSSIIYSDQVNGDYIVLRWLKKGEKFMYGDRELTTCRPDAIICDDINEDSEQEIKLK